MKNPIEQVAQWIEKLAPFDYTIEHRAGKLHSNADSLSRMPCDGGCSECLKMTQKQNPQEIPDTSVAALPVCEQDGVSKPIVQCS